jgi:hypothetical protein
MAKSLDHNGRKIIVAGDVTIDWLQWVAKQKENSNGTGASNWALYPGTRMKAEYGGALLLAKMVESATDAKVAGYDLAHIENISPEKVIHSIAMLDTFSLGKEGEDRIFRVKKYGGFSGPIAKQLKQLPIFNDDAEARLIILDDAGNGFRDDRSAWPKAITEDGKAPVVILKMSRPLASGELWDHLLKRHAKNLIVIISANDLREMGVNISRRLSWEKTAEDFGWQMGNNPTVKPLAACRNLIVRFGLDGAIHYTNDRGMIGAKLFYDPVYGEDGYKERHHGDMQGVTAAFVAAFASAIASEGPSGICKGINAGIQKSRQLFLLGFGRSKEDPSYPVSKLFKPTEDRVDPMSEVAIRFVDEKGSKKNGYWTILEECTRGKLESISYSAVIKKAEDSLKHVPAARFGGLFTLDRNEIESYQSIKNLMAEYLEKNDAKIPLSIAVFGPPGSGKSFGVTQLALSIDPERVVKKEFNVAQFTSIDDLTDALHKVRDLVLEGKIPLVFFDEFDATFQGDLGWLKYFLAPMQDGIFKDGETMHPIGKSIFVFAGGTSHTFQQFSREQLKDGLKEKEKENLRLEFRKAKGTDFISRLRGYVNVLGPNRAGDEDAFYIIRRALLLRSLLKRKASQIFDEDDNARIDPGVLRAFIKVPAYKHGARSMEAIIDMSMLANARKYGQAALPPAKQLELHVDSGIFSKLVLRDVLFNDAMERLAMASHEQYVREQKGKKSPDDPVMQPWERLSEGFKESSRDQARQIPEKLQRVGLDFMPFVEKPAIHFTFTDKQVEILAEMEHERWMAERLRNGWVLGSQRDPDKKISPYLVPWSKLTEEVKDQDRNPVRLIPKMLEKAGFEVYSLQ